MAAVGLHICSRGKGIGSMPHSVCADEIRDLAGWLETRFTAAP